MWKLWRVIFRLKRSSKVLDPDEIFLDSRNLPSFNTQQFEGMIERPISKRSLAMAGAIFAAIGVLFVLRVGFIQIAEGENLAARGNQNRLRHTLVFADRG